MAKQLFPDLLIWIINVDQKFVSGETERVNTWTPMGERQPGRRSPAACKKERVVRWKAASRTGKCWPSTWVFCVMEGKEEITKVMTKHKDRQWPGLGPGRRWDSFGC